MMLKSINCEVKYSNFTFRKYLVWQHRICGQSFFFKSQFPKRPHYRKQYFLSTICKLEKTNKKPSKFSTHLYYNEVLSFLVTMVSTIIKRHFLQIIMVRSIIKFYINYNEVPSLLVFKSVPHGS